jgi:hypothetical protein
MAEVVFEVVSGETHNGGRGNSQRREDFLPGEKLWFYPKSLQKKAECKTPHETQLRLLLESLLLGSWRLRNLNAPRGFQNGQIGLCRDVNDRLISQIFLLPYPKVLDVFF